jgi:hypothetical protein
MKSNLLTAMALSSGAVLLASGASAVTTNSIGDCLGAGCIPTTIATGSGSVAIAGSPLGASWTITASATGSPPLAATSLDSNTIAVQATGGGTATVAVTQQGNSLPLGAYPYLSSMSVNPGTSSPAGFSVVETTLNDPTNGLYTQAAADVLSTGTFTAMRADGPFSNTSLFDGPAPFSLTALYTITAPDGCTAAAPCSFNLTINLSSSTVPEPASLTVLEDRRVGLGWLVRRRQGLVKRISPPKGGPSGTAIPAY